MVEEALGLLPVHGERFLAAYSCLVHSPTVLASWFPDVFVERGRQEFVPSSKRYLLVELVSRACETLYSVASPKCVDLSANVLPFLVIQFAYLISASRLARVSHTSELWTSNFWQHENLKKSRPQNI